MTRRAHGPPIRRVTVSFDASPSDPLPPIWGRFSASTVQPLHARLNRCAKAKRPITEVLYTPHPSQYSRCFCFCRKVNTSSTEPARDHRGAGASRAAEGHASARRTAPAAMLPACANAAAPPNRAKIDSASLSSSGERLASIKKCCLTLASPPRPPISAAKSTSTPW